jgi:hypothetical protein
VVFYWQGHMAKVWIGTYSGLPESWPFCQT